MRAGFIELLLARGVDPCSAARCASGSSPSASPTSAPRRTRRSPCPATRRLERANTLLVRDGLIALGLGDDIDRHLAALDAGTIEIATPPLVTAWGRRRA